MSQFTSIYLLGQDEHIDPSYQQLFPKLRGVFSRIESVLEQIGSQVTLVTNDFFVIERLPKSSIVIRDLLKKIVLVEMDYHHDVKKDLIELARQSYPEQSTLIDEFERDYTPAKAVWWLTRRCFLYSIINDARRAVGWSQLLKIGFFIRDVHQQIERSGHVSNKRSEQRLYRGQGMTEKEFDVLRNHLSGFYTSKNFLWATTNPKHALADARLASTKSGLYGVVFRIQVAASIPFFVLDSEYTRDSPNSSLKILCSVDQIFRRGKYRRVEGRIWQVDLVLLDEQHPDLNSCRESLTENLSGDTACEQLISYLILTGQSDLNKQFCEDLILSQSIRNSKQLGMVHQKLAAACQKEEDFLKALTHYKQAVKHYLTVLPANDAHFCAIYHQIAIVLYLQKDLPQALKYAKHSLSIALRASNVRHLQLADLYHLIGEIFYRQEMFIEAIHNYQLALEKKLQVIPVHNLSIASTYTRIGQVCARLNDYPTAVSYHEKALTIRKRCLPPNHPKLAETYYNLAIGLERGREYKEAVESTSRALNVARHAFGSYHPRVYLYKDFLGKLRRKTLIGVIPNGAVYE